MLSYPHFPQRVRLRRKLHKFAVLRSPAPRTPRYILPLEFAEAPLSEVADDDIESDASEPAINPGDFMPAAMRTSSSCADDGPRVEVSSGESTHCQFNQRTTLVSEKGDKRLQAPCMPFLIAVHIVITLQRLSGALVILSSASAWPDLLQLSCWTLQGGRR